MILLGDCILLGHGGRNGTCPLGRQVLSSSILSCSEGGKGARGRRWGLKRRGGVDLMICTGVSLRWSSLASPGEGHAVLDVVAPRMVAYVAWYSALLLALASAHSERSPPCLVAVSREPRWTDCGEQKGTIGGVSIMLVVRVGDATVAAQLSLSYLPMRLNEGEVGDEFVLLSRIAIGEVELARKRWLSVVHLELVLSRDAACAGEPTKRSSLWFGKRAAPATCGDSDFPFGGERKKKGSESPFGRREGGELWTCDCSSSWSSHSSNVLLW